MVLSAVLCKEREPSFATGRTAIQLPAASRSGLIAQGDVWWADLGDPTGSEPGVRRPVIVVQGDSFNRSALPSSAKLELVLAGIATVLGR